MGLKKLKRELYGTREGAGRRLEDVISPQLKAERQARSQEWKTIKKGPTISDIYRKYQKRLRAVLVIAIVAFLLISGIIIWRGFTSFDKDAVSFEIQGPERIASGEETVYRAVYSNDAKLTLKDVKLVFRYPEGSLPVSLESIDLPDLQSGKANTVELPVKLFGAQGDAKRAIAELSYQPGDISSRFKHEAEFETEIVSVPVALAFDLPDVLADGQSFDFSLRIINKTATPIDDLRVEIKYPGGFTFESASPEPSGGDDIWMIDELTMHEEKEIVIDGALSGSEGEVKAFKADLGVREGDDFVLYLDLTESTRISLSPLLVSQEINGAESYTAHAGDTLEYIISYKNTTNVGIGSVNIVSRLSGEVLDFSTVKTQTGSFDGNDIVWKASNLPELAYLEPYEEGTVSFSIEVKDPLPVNNYQDKNFVIDNQVIIDSSEVPPSLEGVEIAGKSESAIKVESQLALQAQGYYNDDAIPNSGPIPPKVGQMTTYTLKWRLVNYSNDLKDVVIEAFLPPQIQWMDNYTSDNGEIDYHSQTGRLTWNVGRLPAATGILLPVKEASFQVGLVPNVAQVGQRVALMNISALTAKDEFTDAIVYATDEAIYTDLPDDPSIGHNDGRVVQ